MKSDEDKRQDLTKLVAKTLLPLISPYDLSNEALMNHFHNNPYFQHCVSEMVNILMKKETLLNPS